MNIFVYISVLMHLFTLDKFPKLSFQVKEYAHFKMSSHEWIKMWYVYTHVHTHWDITQPLKRMKQCHLQQHEWT